MKPLPLLLAFLVFAVIGWFAADYFDDTPEGSTYQATIDSLVVQRDAARARADSALLAGHRSDTVLVAITDTVRVVVRVAQERASVNADSLRVTLNATQAALLDSIQAAHADEVAAVWRIADERLAWGEGWRTAALKADSVARVERALADTERAFRESETRRAERAKWERNASIAINVVQLALGAT